MEETSAASEKTRRAGEVVGVRVNRELSHPVRIACRGHVHHYEVAWRNTSDGPVISDLRVTSDGGTPITSHSLKRINAEVLARCAKRYDTDQAAKSGRMLGNVMQTALADVMTNPDPAARVAGVLEWMDDSGDEFTAEVAADMRRRAKSSDLSDLAEWVDDWFANRGESFIVFVSDTLAEALIADAVEKGVVPPPKPRGGRPRKVTREFLEQVAEWAREAKDNNSDKIYEDIRRRAELVRGYEIHSTDTVKKWIRSCKDEGLLGDAELRRPRQDREDR